MQRRARRYPNVLPSFVFTKTPLGFTWEPGPGLQAVEPRFSGFPYLLVAEGVDPYIISPRLKFPALWATHVELAMRVPKRYYLSPGEDQGCIMWESKRYPGFASERRVCFPVHADGKVHNYEVALENNIHWARAGLITRLRLDPVAYPATIELYWLEFKVL